VNEKPHKIDMGFGEALARLARVPRKAVPKSAETNESPAPPRKTGVTKHFLAKKAKKR
jgi:hypothetical protein